MELKLKVVFVSSALPRRCGLATFTRDLSTAIAAITPWDIAVCAVDRDGAAYGPEVRTVIRQDDAEDYRRAARSIAAAGTDLAVIQHEFGIFGGPDGCHILEFADELRLRGVRYLVTLHTILSNPSDGQRATLAALCAGAARVTVFTQGGRRLAATTGIAKWERLAVAPHGAPVVLRQRVARPLLSAPVTAAIDQLGQARLVTTFGLVGPGKGLEQGIAAIGKVAGTHPDVHYLIAGATHPDVLRREGERYREELHELAAAAGIGDRVHFIDRFLTEPELSALLARTDLFFTPYRSAEQICSGALTFALAAGLPVVSTAYQYAIELLAPQGGDTAPGVLVPCDDTGAMAEAISRMFTDPATLGAARVAAGAFGATLTWPRVAQRFAGIITDARHVPHPARVPAPTRYQLNLAHLERLTDDVGIIQFAQEWVPDPQSGFCVDDMARLGIVAAGLHIAAPADQRAARWLRSSLRFLEAAAGTASGGLHNLMGPQGRWSDDPHPGDHVGRAIWAAGAIAATAGIPRPIQDRARRLLHRIAPLGAAADSPRTHAYALLGMTRCLGSKHDPLLGATALKLAAQWRTDPAWPWCEDVLAYDNARLPQALLAAGRRLRSPELIDRALTALNWYLKVIGLGGPDPMLRVVGNRWRAKASEPADGDGDEQPIDAAAVVEALLLAWRHTGSRTYAELARQAFAWFHGANRAGKPLYDAATGGCRDGLSAVHASINQGAESTLAYYQALLALAEAELITIRWPAGSQAPQPGPRTPKPLQNQLHRSTHAARR